MKLVTVDELFYVKYGTNLELNALTIDSDGVAFVGRSSNNNGVTNRVQLLPSIEPIESGTITVAAGGSVLSTFLQPEQFYSGRDVYCLTPRNQMSDAVKLYYCNCISANKYRYNYGRQANRTLKTLKVPSLENVPLFIANKEIDDLSAMARPYSSVRTRSLNIAQWREFKYDQLFHITRGRGPRKKDLDNQGNTPFITSIDKNNGLTGFAQDKPEHRGNTLTVNRNGSVAEAFYQPVDFCSTEDVHVYTPKFNGFNKYIGLFLVTLIKSEKYRYGYGRKWGIERMNNSTIKLPVTPSNEPDWEFIESYIKSLPYSSFI